MSHVLLQFGEDPFNARFEDLEGRIAFTITEVEKNPNMIHKITREAQWSQRYPQMMGPRTSFFYFGPSKSPGSLVYGNGPLNPMTASLRKQSDGSSSRYFTTPNKKQYKWRLIGDGKMECLDGKTPIATWETAFNDQYQGRLTIKEPGLPICTEIVTTLMLNRMAQVLHW